MKHLIYRVNNLRYKGKLILACILVGLIPLTLLGAFCYYQTISLLLAQETDALTSAANTAWSSLDSQIQLYENLIAYLAHSETVVKVSSKTYDSKVEKYEILTYEYDVLLNNTFAQHPEISQITLYVDRDDLFHGKQLRPLSDMENQSWYGELENAARPMWLLDSDGMLCLFQRVPTPYIKFVSAYSGHCLCIRFNPKHFFQILTDISNNYHVIVGTDTQTVYEYSDFLIDNSTYPRGDWISLNLAPLSNDWDIMLEKPYALLAAPANRMALIICVVVFVCIMLIFLVSNLWSDFFAGKVERLLSVMREVQKGELSVEIHDECPDEMGELANSFQLMIDELNRMVVEDYKNKIILKETQLLALQAQINPHFFYNCLSQINSKAILNHQEEISRMAQLLSTFYRTTLNKGKSETTLANEIKNVKSYIDIQLLLNDHAFDVDYQIDVQLPEQEVPNLLLQPLVENAIMHGILPNKTRRGKVFLSITCVNSQILFAIMDNGLGIPAEKIPLLTCTQSGGYGLKNVHERLQLAYGTDCGLTVNSILNESTMITFSIPVRQ